MIQGVKAKADGLVAVEEETLRKEEAVSFDSGTSRLLPFRERLGGHECFEELYRML